MAKPNCPAVLVSAVRVPPGPARVTVAPDAGASVLSRTVPVMERMMPAPVVTVVTVAVMVNVGAVVAGASVVLTHTETGVRRSGSSNEAGIYRFDAVDLGVYEIEVYPL